MEAQDSQYVNMRQLAIGEVGLRQVGATIDIA
jgi:hypothetical protein